MNYQKALIQFAFIGVIIPLALLAGIYVFYQDLQDSVAQHQALYNKLTTINTDITATQKKATAYQTHKEVLQRIQSQNFRTYLPTLFPLLGTYGLDKELLQYRLGFSDDNPNASMKQFTSTSINLQLVGRYNTLLQAAYAIECSSPSLFVSSFTLANNSPPTGLKGIQVDQPLSLNIVYGTLNIPPIP